jgi:F0F1-type ATP synthase membrane subunit b/b'
MRIILISLMVTGTALAGGKGGHGNIADLIPPAVNFFILVTFLVIKLKAPIRNLFIKKAEAISETLERANVKSKEAQVMLETQQKKLSNLDNEIKTINEDAEKEIATFNTSYADEMTVRAQKLKQDAAAKIEAERKALFEKVNSKLIDNIIAKASSTLKTNNDLRSKINKKITQEIK